MTTRIADRGGKPGRKTNQETIEDWLQGLDLPPEVTRAIRDADPRVQVTPTGVPGSFQEMFALAAADLYAYYDKATGIAKVQTFKAIHDLAKAEAAANDAGTVEGDPLVADIVSGVASLSPIRKREILTVEREHLRIELVAVEDALALMDAEAVLV